MNCDSVLERVALGSWENNDEVTAHLSVCPQCRLRVEAAEALGEHLRDPLLWEEPPDHLRQQVVEAVKGESAFRDRRPRWILGAVAALALAVVAFVVSLDRPDWTVNLVAQDPEAPMTASVDGWNMDYGTKMMIEVTGLDPSGSDAYYELWLTAPDGRHVSAGTFRTSGRFEMMAGVRRADFPRLWITREPMDDDPGPFPDTVLDMPEA